MAARIGIKSMANFCRQIAISLRSGLTLSRAFPIITRECRDQRLRRALQEIDADITAGHTLSEALRKRSDRFSPIFLEMVDAGERSGRLEEVFAQLADYFDRRLKIRRAVIRASIYPLIQLSFAYAVFCLMMVIFSSNKRATGETIVFFTIIAVLALGAIIFFFLYTETGRAIRSRIAVSLPLFRSVTIKLCMARFTRALAMQLESAVPMVEAIERSALATGNIAVANNLRLMAGPVRDGYGLADAVNRSRMVPPMIREVLMVGEETGNFSEALERVADIYEDESMVVLESAPKFIGPIVIIIVAIVVVYLFITVYIGQWIKPFLDIIG